MEPVVSILLQALPVLAGAASTELAKRSIGEAWDGIKKALQRRYGAEHEAPRLLDELRATGAGAGAANIAASGPSEVSKYLATRLSGYPLDSDAEIIALAQQLAAALPPAAATASVTMMADNMYGNVGHNAGSITQNFSGKA